MALIVTDAAGNSYSLLVNAADMSMTLTPAPHITPTPGAANSITVKASDLIRAAMFEIGALAAGETVPPDDASWILQKLQRLIDRYNARLPMVYNVGFSRFPLVANRQPHTIGPGGDFDTIQRPISIPTISLILNTPGEVELQLNARDQQWWANQTLKGLTSTLPTDFYYSPDWPLGQIYFWPIPTVVNDVRVQSRNVLTEITNYNQNFSLPPAYWDLIVYELAISLGPGFEKEPSPTLVALWKAAVKAVQVNNVSSPRLSSDSPSQPRSGASRPDFNFLNGLSNG